MHQTARLRRVCVFMVAIAVATIGMLAVPVPPSAAGTFGSDITGVHLTPSGHPGLCVTATSPQSNAPIRLRECGDNDALQQWTVTADDRILLTSNPTRCIGNPNNAQSENISIALSTSCSTGANNATWRYRLQAGSGAPAGAFVNSYADMCMTVKDANYATGEWIVRRTCDDAEEQQFSIGSTDMRVTAVANPTGKPGAVVQPQLRIENIGSQTAYYNRLAVTADTGLTIASLQRYFAASTGYAECVVDSGTAASCPAGAAWSAGGTGTVFVNATIPSDAAPGAVYQVCGDNTVSPTNDGNAGNDSACATVTVAHLASDLAMTDTATGGHTATTTVEPGASAQIPFTLTNNGPDTAGVPEVAFEAPADFTLTGITGPDADWTCDLDARTCTGPEDAFANTAVAAFTVTGTVASGLTAGGEIGDVTATASVSGKSRDGDATDDTAHNTLTVDADVTMEVAKTGAATADPGGPIEYTVTVDNSGATGLEGASVTDTVPDDIDVTSWTCAATGGGSCGTASGTTNAVATTVDVPAGEQVVITIAGTVAPTAAGTTVTNAATIAMPAGIGGGATSSTDTAINNYTDIEVTAEPVTLTPGTSGTVTAAVRNDGPADAADTATVTLTYPVGVTVSDLDDRCTDNGDGTATCEIPAETLTNGATTDLAFTAALPADTASGTVLTGTAAADYPLDDDTGDNSADLTVNAGDAVTDFAITATDPETVLPGESGTVTFTLRNDGPSTSVTDATATLRAPPAAAWDTTGQPAGCTATADRELTCTVPAGAAPGAETDVTLAYTVGTAAMESTATGTGIAHSAEDDNAANDTAEWSIDIAAPSADLRIDKTAASGSVTPGDQFDYTLTVHNDGPSTAVAATVTDTLPAQLTFVSAIGTGASCELAGQTVTCAYAALAPGSQTVTLTVQVDPSYTGTGADLPNSATVGADTADPDTANNTSGTATPAVGDAVADLALTKQTATDTPIAPGETFTYLLEAVNDGPSTATGAVVTDDLPSALAFVESESGCAGTAGEYGGTVTCEPGTLGSGDEAALLITVQLDSAYTGTGTDAAVTNTASLAADTLDPNTGDNAPTTGLPGGGVAAASADVSMSKDRITPGPVAPGEPVAYTVTAHNDGPSNATTVDVTDTLPTGMTFASSPDGCTASGQTVTCPQIASLATGSAVSYQVVANVDADYTGDGGDLVNAANATSQDTADPDTADNTDAAQLPVGGVSAPSADLAIAKTSAGDAGGVSPGEQFTYTLTVENQGPSDATAVTVDDVLPASVSFVSSPDCTGTVGQLGGTVACGPLAALPAASGSSTADFVVTVELDPAYSGTGTDVVNAATVASGTADPSTVDNATGLTGVPSLAAGEADLEVTNTVVGSPEIAPGATLTYRVEATNQGPSTAVNPTITDTLGANLTWDSYPSGCTVDGQNLTCPPGGLGALQLAPAATVTFDAGVRLDSGYTGDGGDLTSTATVASDTLDPVSGNDTATATGGVTVTAPVADLQTVKEITTSGEVAPGEVIDYRVSVSNAGPSDASDVTVTETLPAGLTFEGAANGTCTADGQTVTCDPTASIAAGDTVNHLYRVTVDPSYTGTGSDLGTTATATSASTADSDTENNTAPEVVPSIGAPSANLRMTKQLNTTGAVIPGNTFRYALTVDNLGPSTAQNATLTDTLDDDLAFVSSTPDECTATGQAVTCSHDDALPVASHTWVLTVRLSADYTGDGSDIANTAAVASDTADPDAADNTGTVSGVSAAAPSADVALTQAANGTAAVAPGESFDYTITVANAGPSTATDIAVADTLPTGLAFVSSADCTAAGQNLTCTTVDAIAVGAQTAYTFTARIDPDYTGTGDDLINTATATPATADPNAANNTGTATVPGGAVAAPSADVSMALAAVGTGPIVPGATFDYTLTAANAGPSTATGVAVADTLPTGLAFVSSADCTADTDYGATVTCTTVNSLAVGGNTAYTVTVMLDPAYTGTGDDLLVTATATPATADPDAANNTGTATVPGGTVAAPSADVSITETANGAVTAGSTGEYAITVANAGPSTAQAVTVTDTLPAGLSFAAATGATCTADGGIVTCDLGAINPGDQIAFSVTVDVAPSVPDGTVLTDAAEVTTTTTNTSNDTTTSADLTVTAEAGVSLAKTPPGSMTAGANADYTFTVQNQGPSDATGVAIAATLDTGLTFVSATGATCTPNGSLVTCDVGTVADGATAAVALTVAVAADTAAGTQLSVNATLTTATTNTSPDTTALATGPEVNVTADLAMAQEPVETAAIAPGQTFDYRLTVANQGPSNAADPVVTDELPATLAFVSSTDGCTGDAGVFGGAVTCEVGSALADGDEAVFTFTVRLDPAVTGDGAEIIAKAVVDSPTHDPLSDNDTAEARLPGGAAAPPIADLSVVKTLNSNAPVTPGNTFTYTITVSNAGPSNAAGLLFTDTLPDPLSWIQAVPPATACQLDGRTVNCSTGLSVPAGFTRTITATVELDPSYTGDGSDLVNTGTISSATADPQPGNNSTVAAAVTAGDPRSDLMLTKGFAAFPGAQILPGQTTDIMLSLNNYGPSTATDVVVTDNLPPELAFVSSFDGCTGEPGVYGGVFNCPTVERITPDEAVVFIVTVRLDPNYTGNGSTVVGVATVDASNPDPSLPNNTATSNMDGGVAEAVSNLVIHKTAPDAMIAGREAVWTIDVGNDGPSTATGVTVTDTLDPDTTFVSASPDVCTAVGQEVTCDLDSIALADTETIELTVMVDDEVDSGTTIANTASVVAETDPGPDSSTVVGPPVQVETDLAVGKEFDPGTAGPVTPGTEFNYLVTVDNLSAAEAAENVTITDSLPAELAFVGATNADTDEALDCDTTGDTIVCDLAATLDPSASVTAAVTVQLDPSYRGDGEELTNLVEVSSDAVDPNGDNDTAELSGVPGGAGDPVYDRSIAMVDVPAAPPGGTTELSLVVESTGPSTVDGPVTVKIGMPEHVDALSGLPSDCEAEPGNDTVVCTIETPTVAQTETTGLPGLLRRAEAILVAEADPSMSWSTTITVAIDDDAPESAYLTGGTVALNADPDDADGGSDAVAWRIRTMSEGSGGPGGSGNDGDSGGSGDARDLGDLVRTGGESLALVLTGLGAIMTGMFITVVVARRRADK